MLADVKSHVEPSECMIWDIPDTKEFREWVSQTLYALDLTPYGWSISANVAPNLVSKFLSGEQTDLRLHTASCLVRAAFRIAREKNLSVPSLPQHQEQA